MLFKVQNTQTGSFLKDAISGRVRLAPNESVAQKWADDCAQWSIIPALVNLLPIPYRVIPA